MSNRFWCEHCDSEMSESGAVAVRDCTRHDGVVDVPTDGDGVRFRRRLGKFQVPQGKVNGYLLGNCCCHCEAAMVAMEAEGD